MSNHNSSDRKYRLFRRNLKLEELQEKYRKKYSEASSHKGYSVKDYLWLLVILLILISIPFTLWQIQGRKTLNTVAQKLSFSTYVEAEQGALLGNILISESILASAGKYIQFSSKENIIDVTSCPAFPANTEKVTFRMQVPFGGDYYPWIRLMTADSENNSLYLQVDNICQEIAGDAFLPRNSWMWVNYRRGNTSNIIKLNLNSGLHTITLYQREQGVKADKIILTTDVLCKPVLTGDNCLINK
ncbi:hypothetical protein A2Y99_04305 [Candidatus Gottesmanbacteria bacterium RBG_13_37_7]|uniref:Gylcosyl hydrolase 115 C-terminal domain-containing protein n=1 Tax=Candidatus Gottesmanbacteria bacterium RBG_13_37_7 TaxID=1798369 RepID=A0A1F5YI72_9BACT|nr:MAG: hypothetical protein A2Y99_04305 [Candidatus Gottesmanbacteria bacterium RBG_13_37_7]